MFCNECGAPLTGVANVCGKCGKPVPAGAAGGVAVAAAPATRSLMIRQRQILGVLWLIYAIFGCLRGLIVVGAGAFLPTFGRQWAPDLPGFVGPLVGMVGIAMLLFSAAGIIVGYGLMKTAPWARTLAIVMGVIVLLSIPVGTALGIYTLVVTLSGTAEADWRRVSAPAA